MNLANMKRSETTEQISLFNWARANEAFIPELRLLHHVPNEGKRTNGAVLKAAGLKNRRSGSLSSGSAPGLSRAVYRNEVRIRKNNEETGRIYGVASAAGI